jgi:hypothetical protein
VSDPGVEVFYKTFFWETALIYNSAFSSGLSLLATFVYHELYSG